MFRADAAAKAFRRAISATAAAAQTFFNSAESVQSFR